MGGDFNRVGRGNSTHAYTHQDGVNWVYDARTLYRGHTYQDYTQANRAAPAPLIIQDSSTHYNVGNTYGGGRGDNRANIAVLATVVLLVGSFFVARAKAYNDNTAQDLETVNARIDSLADAGQRNTPVGRVLNAQAVLLEAMHEEGKTDFYLKIWLVAGSAMTLVASVFLSASAMGFFGVFGIVAPAAALLFVLGYNTVSNNIERKADLLGQELENYDRRGRQPQQTQQPQSDSLFDQFLRGNVPASAPSAV